jgi:hypothetical protein
MSAWSLEAAIAMERRHILEGEKRVDRQEALVGELILKGHSELALTAAELLGLLRGFVAVASERLQTLEQRRLGTPPDRN